ncbi:hypothetical protein D046_2556B, partial [Vibrio parahaemolyticus V-223/04]
VKGAFTAPSNALCLNQKRVVNAPGIML